VKKRGALQPLATKLWLNKEYSGRGNDLAMIIKGDATASFTPVKDKKLGSACSPRA